MPQKRPENFGQQNWIGIVKLIMIVIFSYVVRIVIFWLFYFFTFCTPFVCASFYSLNSHNWYLIFLLYNQKLYCLASKFILLMFFYFVTWYIRLLWIIFFLWFIFTNCKLHNYNMMAYFPASIFDFASSFVRHVMFVMIFCI